MTLPGFSAERALQNSHYFLSAGKLRLNDAAEVAPAFLTMRTVSATYTSGNGRQRCVCADSCSAEDTHCTCWIGK